MYLFSNLLTDNGEESKTTFDFPNSLMKLFENSTVPFVMFQLNYYPLQTTILEVNKAFCEKMGYSRNEVISKRLTNICGWPIEEMENPSSAKGGHRQNIVSRSFLQDKIGRRVAFEIHQHISYIDSISIGLAMLIDISDQLNYLLQLTGDDGNYKEIVEQSPDAIIICDRNSIKYANKSGIKFLGFKRFEDIAGQPFELFTHNEYCEKLKKQISYVLDKKEQVSIYETKFKRYDDIEFYINCSANYLNYNGLSAVQIIVRDVTEKIRSQNILRYMAYHDDVTGLCNRMHFYDKLTSYIDQNRLTDNIAAVLYLDVDGFKSVNDSLGPASGDKLIIAVSERLKLLIDKRHIAARGEGDEFLILIGDTTKEIVESYANRIINGFREPFYIDNHELYLTMSIGISYFPENGRDATRLVKNSNIALCSVKNVRDNIRTFDITLKEKLDEQVRTKHNLRKALEKEEFLIHYQPKININSGEIIGAEALIRWNYQGISMVSPNEFIPIAEDSRLIIPIGEWVLYNVCRQHNEWKKKGIGEIRTAVNISAVQLQNQNFINTVNQILKDTKLNPNCLEFEITESALINNFTYSNEVLNELRSMGIDISLDDFGTGYSSLCYLRNLNIDNLKIDRSFIRDIVKDKKNSDIVKGIIEMAHVLGIAVIAEGVEDVNQLKVLKQFKCDYIQGYLFSKPLPRDDYEKLIQTSLYKAGALYN